jgi:hypothetical protein
MSDDLKMPSLSFREYVKTRRPGYTRIGRYLEGVRADPEFVSITTPQALEAYLDRKGVASNDRDFARAIWRTYEKAKGFRRL